MVQKVDPTEKERVTPPPLLVSPCSHFYSLNFSFWWARVDVAVCLSVISGFWEVQVAIKTSEESRILGSLDRGDFNAENRPSCWLTDRLTDWFIIFPTNPPPARAPATKVIDTALRIGHWLTDWLTDWLRQEKGIIKVESLGPAAAAAVPSVRPSSHSHFSNRNRSFSIMARFVVHFGLFSHHSKMNLESARDYLHLFSPLSKVRKWEYLFFNSARDSQNCKNEASSSLSPSLSKKPGCL